MPYSIINSILANIAADFSAAQAHGFAVGLLCVDTKTPPERWLLEFIQNRDCLLDKQKQLLFEFYATTKDSLAGDQFEFTLFLPADDSDLSGRAEALIAWCLGFLLGLGLSHQGSSWSKEAQEIIKDITEFTKLDCNVDGEEDEYAFMEISEYLRTAVFILSDECQAHHHTSSLPT